MNKVINGGCWVGPFEDETPPCSKGHFSYEGGCYMYQVEPPKPEPSTEKRLDGGQ